LKNSPDATEEIAGQGHLYGRKYHVDEFIFMWEMIMVKKHFERLTKKGLQALMAKRSLPCSLT
jgi:hypothetical protein